MKRTVLNLMVAAVLTAGCVTHRPLVNPEAKVPSTIPQEQVKRTVHEALNHYGWVIDDVKPGATTAHLQQKDLFARVRVDYDERHATVRYVESKNMKYSKSASGEEKIHSRYLVWARNIAERINNSLDAQTLAIPAAGSLKKGQ